MSSSVYVVHAIDTEGPLTETVQATFERLRDVYGVDLPASLSTLAKLQSGEIDLGVDKEAVRKMIAPDLLRYNSDWSMIGRMLDEIMNDDFRNIMRDSFGGGWVYNWHCLDHVGFTDNPRRREIGFHNVFDYFAEKIESTGSTQDGVHFHHHPVAFSKSAHHSGSHYFNHTPIIFEILARRILDRQWFPCLYRPGFHVERPDSHWFLEQFIPFDLANQRMGVDQDSPIDQSRGRGGDWRRAPCHWAPYHPAHDDYQSEGNCRRWIGRCLNVGTRYRLMAESDVEQAFSEAASGRPVVLAFTNHDHRDMRPDIAYVRDLLTKVSARWPNVPFRFSEGREAMRSALQLSSIPAPEFDFSFDGKHLHVVTKNRIFGPQPFLAYKSHDGRYFHDNFDFEVPFREWRYTFDPYTLPAAAVKEIGFAACDDTGGVSVQTIDVQSGRIRKRTI